VGLDKFFLYTRQNELSTDRGAYKSTV
jgi:hypothetical protein